MTTIALTALGPTGIIFTLRVHSIYGLWHSSRSWCGFWSLSSSSLLHRKYSELVHSCFQCSPQTIFLSAEAWLSLQNALPFPSPTRLLLLGPTTHSSTVDVCCSCWSNGEVSSPVILTHPPLICTPALLKSSIWEANLLSFFSLGLCSYLLRPFFQVCIS